MEQLQVEQLIDNATAALHAAPPLRLRQCKVIDLTAFAAGIAVALIRGLADR
ncbi:MAG: hypothetical protein ACLQDV_06305 [Candidatus Binataceae bacterium]